MKIIDVITFRVLLLFPENSGKFPEILNFGKMYNPNYYYYDYDYDYDYYYYYFFFFFFFFFFFSPSVAHYEDRLLMLL